MKQIEIPPFLAHRPVDERGYPVPFFVAKVDGKYDFRLMDARKQQRCRHQGLCGVCGKKLTGRVAYVVTGKAGQDNGVHSDPPMHRWCAEYSLATCPHLALERAERRDTNLPEAAQAHPGTVRPKPPVVYLLKVDKIRFSEQHQVFVFRILDRRYFTYQGGRLTESITAPSGAQNL